MVKKCSGGELCDTEGLEDDEDYNNRKHKKEEDHQTRQRRSTFRLRKNTEKMWSHFEKELKMIFKKGREDHQPHLKESKPKTRPPSVSKYAM